MNILKVMLHRVLIVLIFVYGIAIHANTPCSDWHNNQFQSKKDIVTLDNSRKEHLAHMMKQRAENLLEGKVSNLPHLSQNGNYYFSSYSSLKKPKRFIDLIFNERGILLSYELTKEKKNEFFCLSESLKE